MTDQSVHYDASGLANLTTGLGVAGYDSTLNFGVSYFAPLQQSAQNRWTRQFSICRKVVTTIPDTMTERWGTFTIGGKSGKDSTLQWINQKLNNIQGWDGFSKVYGLRNGFNSAQRKANQTGNGAIVLLIDDGKNFWEPVDYKNIKSVKEFLVYDRWELAPVADSIYSSGQITHYRRTGYTKLLDNHGNRIIRQDELIHSDRVLWFRGQEIIDKQELLSNQCCDDSVLDSFVAAFASYNGTISGLEYAATKQGAQVLKVKNLLSGLKSGGEQQFKDRYRLFYSQLSLYRAGVIDKDIEELQDVTVNAAGLADISSALLDWCIANTDLFPWELVGQQLKAGGLSDPGESALQQANRRTSRYQSKKFDSHIREAIKYLLLSKEAPTKGKEPDSWGWDWLPLFDTTPSQQAELELNRAQIISTLASVDPTQGMVAAAMIASAYGGEKFNPYPVLPESVTTALNDATKPPPEEEPVDEGAGGEFEGDFSAEGEPAPEDQATEEAPPETAGGQQQLDDNQTSKLLEIVKSVNAGEVPRDSAQKIITLSFGLSPEDAIAVLGSAGGNKQPEEEPAEPTTLEDVLDSADIEVMDAGDRYSSIDFTPPVKVRKAFKKGLADYKKYGGGKGLEPVTVREAEAIARGEAVSPAKVVKGWRFGLRNKRFGKQPDGTPGKVSWGLWGFDEGFKWFSRLKTQMDLVDSKADSIRADKKCGKSGIPDDRKCRIGESAKHAGEHLAESVAGWGVGKVVGGAIASAAISHGFPPELSNQIAESGIQALAATALHARKKENRTPGELARKFVAEAAGAYAGKFAHSGVDDAILGGDEHVKALAALVAGKSVGASSVLTLKATLDKHGKAIASLLARKRRNDSIDHLDTGNADQLSSAEQEALFDLTLIGALQSQQDREDSVRTSCLECVTKHLGSAIVLIDEAEHGYPEHKLLAIGHLAQAEDESLDQYPWLAAAIRDIRKRYWMGEIPDADEFYSLLDQAGVLDTGGIAWDSQDKEWHIDASKRSTAKVGDTKIKDGKKYQLNANKRWTRVKDETTPAEPKKKRGSKKELDAESAAKADEVVKSARKQGKEKNLEDLDPATKSVVEKAKQLVEPSASVNDEPISDRKEFTAQLKQWQGGIKDVKLHNEYQTELNNVEKTKKEIESVTASKETKFAGIDNTVFPPRRIAMDKKTKLSQLEKERKRLEKSAAGLGKKISREPSVDSTRFGAAEVVYDDLNGYAKDKSLSVGGVRGADGKMGAAYIYKPEKDHLYLEFLATSPENLFKDGKPTKGAGSRAIKQLIRQGIKEGSGGAIKLTALDDAIPFYQKIGFTLDSPDGGKMTLTKEAAKRFLEG